MQITAPATHPAAPSTVADIERMSAAMDAVAVGPAATFKRTLYEVARPAFEKLETFANSSNPEVPEQRWIKHSASFTSGDGQAALHGARDAVRLLSTQLSATADALPDTTVRDNLRERSQMLSGYADKLAGVEADTNRYPLLITDTGNMGFDVSNSLHSVPFGIERTADKFREVARTLKSDPTG